LPSDLPPGEYKLIVGLFEPDSFFRPAVNIGGTAQENNQVLLFTLERP
jgi:hypothetical protein